MEFGGAAGAELKELTFFPDPGPSHLLARYEEGSSSLITLHENADAVPLQGTAVSIDPVPSEAARYLIIRYDDGRAEVWSGLEDIRRLATHQMPTIFNIGRSLWIYMWYSRSDVKPLIGSNINTLTSYLKAASTSALYASRSY